LGCLDADTSTGSVEKREWAILDSEVMLTLVPRRERASVLMTARPLTTQIDVCFNDTSSPT